MVRVFESCPRLKQALLLSLLLTLEESFTAKTRMTLDAADLSQT
jgi:hypothetical protein